MGSYSVTEARKKLSELISQATRGESVVITRRGIPVVEFKTVSAKAHGPPPKITKAGLDWLDAHRIKPSAKSPAELPLRERDNGRR